MISTFLSVSLLALAPTADPLEGRERNPFAPSLPQLTEKEERYLDGVINRFILYDTGSLTGEPGLQALRAFQGLGPEASFALIRGLNVAANINHSCPALVIAKKLNSILSASKDIKLLEFARDEIGSGVGRSRHHAVLQDLRVKAMLQKNLLLRQGVAPLTADGKKEARYMTTRELTEAAKEDGGLRLKQVVVELGKRKGEEAVEGLRMALDRHMSDVSSLARSSLRLNLQKKQPKEVVRSMLSNKNSDVKKAAIRAAYGRKLPVGRELIDLLEDKDDEVATLAHRALVLLAKKDFGPSQNANQADREKAIAQWREWWQSRGR